MCRYEIVTVASGGIIAVSADPTGAVYRHAESLRREGFEEIVGTLCRELFGPPPNS